ncbi:MAG: ABC transporter permease [Wujia sp.]
MFWHSFKGCLRVMVKGKVTLFWTMIFPILLTTFMYVTFGNLMERDEMFHTVEVAVVDGEGGDPGLMIMLSMLDAAEDPLIHINTMKKEEALQKLDDKKVDGVIFTEDCSLVVRDSGVSSTILEQILLQYKQNATAIKDQMENEAQSFSLSDLSGLMDGMQEQVSYCVQTSLTSGTQNPYYNFFYAIFAMSCLFSGFSSLGAVNNMQANISAKGMRRSVSPANKGVVIVSEFLALLCMHFLVEVLVLVYMMILGIDFGNNIPAVLLILLFGCMIGLAFGVIIGSITKMSEASKVGVVIAVSMTCSVLADLCINGIKHLLAQNVPIINKINPAALLSDSFYALNIYDDYSCFTQNLIILAVESAVLLLIAFLRIRRNKYASV